MLAGSAALFGASAMAQESSVGQEIFIDRCAVCHGETGAGDGLVGELFDRKPKNLTLLEKENNGAFPFSEVYQSIDGRREIAGHGNSKMPVWGEYFMEDAITSRAIDPKDAKVVTQGRILAVVYFLQSIQQR